MTTIMNRLFKSPFNAFNAKIKAAPIEVSSFLLCKSNIDIYTVIGSLFIKHIPASVDRYKQQSFEFFLNAF